MLNTVHSNVYVDVNNYHFHMILYLKYQYQSLYGLFLSEKSYTETENNCINRTTAEVQNTEEEWWNQPEVRVIIPVPSKWENVNWIELLLNQTILPLSKDPWGSLNPTWCTQLQSIEGRGRCREGRGMWGAEEVGVLGGKRVPSRPI